MASRKNRGRYRQVVAARHERAVKAGRAGAMATHSLYSYADFQRWGRMGGRPKDPTLAELRAQGAI